MGFWEFFVRFCVVLFLPFSIILTIGKNDLYPLAVLNILVFFLFFREQIKVLIINSLRLCTVWFELFVKQKHRQKLRYYAFHTIMYPVCGLISATIIIFIIFIIDKYFYELYGSYNLILGVFLFVVLLIIWWMLTLCLHVIICINSVRTFHKWNLAEIQRVLEDQKKHKTGPVYTEFTLIHMNNTISTVYDETSLIKCSYGGHLNSGFWEMRQLAATLSIIGLKRELLLRNFPSDEKKVVRSSSTLPVETFPKTWAEGSVLNRKILTKFKENRDRKVLEIEKQEEENLQKEKEKKERWEEEMGDYIRSFNFCAKQVKKLFGDMLPILEKTILEELKPDTKATKLNDFFPIRIVGDSVADQHSNYIFSLLNSLEDLDIPFTKPWGKPNYYHYRSKPQSLFFQYYVNHFLFEEPSHELSLKVINDGFIENSPRYKEKKISKLNEIRSFFTQELIINLLKQTPNVSKFDEFLRKNNLYFKIIIKDIDANFELDYQEERYDVLNTRRIYSNLPHTRIQVIVDKDFFGYLRI